MHSADPSREKGDSPGGFTLLEILVTTVLLAGVMTSTLLFLFASGAVEDSVRRKISRHEQVQLAFEQLERALGTCLPPGGEYASGLSATSAEAEAEIAADADAPATQMSMVSVAGRGRDTGRLQRFTFRFAVGEEGPPGRLVMNVTPVGEDLAGDAESAADAEDATPLDRVNERLIDALLDVRFQFFDGLEWAAGVWDSAGSGGLPQLVRVEFWFTEPPEDEQEGPLDLPPETLFARTFRLPAAVAVAAEAAEGGGRVIR